MKLLPAPYIARLNCGDCDWLTGDWTLSTAKLHLPIYEEVANWLQVDTGTVKILAHRLRKRHSTVLREEVGRTVSDPAEIDEEIYALCEALIASEERLCP